MTTTTLRTLVARAFAEECRKYVRRRDKRRWCVFSLPDDVCRFVSNIDGVSEDYDLEDCQLFINERGIAAAMRVAAENIGRSDYARNLSWGELTAIGLFLSDTGEIT